MSITTEPTNNPVAAPEDSEPITRTESTDTTDTTSHQVATTDGHKVHVVMDVDTHEVFDGQFDDRVKQLVTEAEDERQAIEDERANHRNLNRMLTLLGALLIGLVVTWTLTHGVFGPLGPTLAPYAFTITIALDSALAAYSFIRHY